LGTFYFVRCQLTTAAEVSAACLKLARDSGRVDYLIEALSFRGYTCVFQGEPVEGCRALEDSLDLYQHHDGQSFRYPSPQDAGTAAWSLLPIAAWLVGDTARAETAVTEALAHSSRVGRPFDVAYAHVWIAMLRNMQRLYDEAERHAVQCIEISERHGFTTWLVAATMQASIARSSRAASPESLALLRHMLQLFIGAGAEANASFFLWGLAEGLVRAGHAAEAAGVVTEALARADASRESFFKSELLVLSASLEDDADAARARLTEALELATRQGAVVLALRAGLALMRRLGAVSDDVSRDDQALQALDGRAPYPSDQRWATTALDGVRAALGRGNGHPTSA
jgi:hypothetical protein